MTAKEAVAAKEAETAKEAEAANAGIAAAKWRQNYSQIGQAAVGNTSLVCQQPASSSSSRVTAE